MKNQKGITLVSLIGTVIVMILLTAITAVASVQSYNQMKYETFVAELQEIQKVVDAIGEDYLAAKKIDESLTYSTYFTNNYGSCPSTISVAVSITTVSDIVTNFGLAEDSEYIFYFTSSNIKTFLGLDGISDSYIIDFSTRIAYSTSGCKDPEEDDDTIYYALYQCEDSTVVTASTVTSSSSSVGVTSSTVTAGSSKYAVVTLTLNRGSSGTDFNIKKAYYSTDGGTTWIEVDYLGDCQYTDDSVSFVIYNSNSYFFKIEDTSLTTVQTSSATSISL